MTAPRLTAGHLNVELAQLTTVARHVQHGLVEIDRAVMSVDDRTTIDALTAIVEFVADRLNTLGEQVEAVYPALRAALPDEPRAGAEPEGDSPAG